MSTSGKKFDSETPFDDAELSTFFGLTVASNKRNVPELVENLVYEALSVDDWEERGRLAEQALKLDPNNVDALLLLVEVSDKEGEERIEILRSIVKIGEAQIDKKLFKELAPHFLDVLETHPYMRARTQLAFALGEDGRLEEASAEYTEMLVLDEDDYLGVRYELLPMLLTQGRLEESRDLLNRFKEDCKWSVVFAWCRVLICVLAKEEAAAVKALTMARKLNAFIETYLKGEYKKMSKNSLTSYSVDSQMEVLCFAETVQAAWEAHPEALEWLLDQKTPKINKR